MFIHTYKQNKEANMKAVIKANVRQDVIRIKVLFLTII